MKMLLLVLAALCLSACVTSAPESRDPGDSPDTTQPENAEQPKGTPLETLRKDIQDVASRAEQKADEIQVQHLLIAYDRAGIPGVTRTLEEAEQLTAELWQKIKDGADFDALIKEHTNDSPPGIYGMTMVGPGDRNKLLFPRTGMVAAFGDVGWRLKVGEYGVAPHHARTSPYGWHIIKRLK